MQQQQQPPYANYSYYPQPMYPQTPYMGAGGPPGPSSNGAYPPFYGPPQPQAPQPAPQNNNPPAPSPYSFDAAAYTVKPGGQSRSRHRRTNTVPTQQQQVGAGAPPALKSAMKKTMTSLNTAENSISRQFSNPFNHQQQQQNPNQTPVVMPRPRVSSNPSYPQNLPVDEPLEVDGNPFHMIVSFHGYNELHIEHILKLALDEMRQVIWPLWPDGMESDTVLGHTCIAKFRNMPWDLSGANVKHTYKLIAEFFQLFQRRGYSFQTAVNIGTTTPRLIFQVTKPDSSEFFIAYFSSEGRRLTLINPPNHIDISFGARLRSALPRKILSDNVVEEYTRVIEVKRKANSSAPEVDPGIFFVEVLKILGTLGFQLDASIPLGRRGPLGIRYTRELLVFKGTIIRDA